MAAKPFPASAIREALGLVRLLWLVERHGTDLDRMRVLTEAGQRLSEALTLSSKRPADALRRAYEGVDMLAGLEWPTDVAEVVRQARERVTAGRAIPADERDAKRVAMAKRG